MAPSNVLTIAEHGYAVDGVDEKAVPFLEHVNREMAMHSKPYFEWKPPHFC